MRALVKNDSVPECVEHPRRSKLTPLLVLTPAIFEVVSIPLSAHLAGKGVRFNSVWYSCLTGALPVVVCQLRSMSMRRLLWL